MDTVFITDLFDIEKKYQLSITGFPGIAKPADVGSCKGECYPPKVNLSCKVTAFVVSFEKTTGQAKGIIDR